MVSARSFLFPFKYSSNVAYVVEFSHLKIRLFAKSQLVTEAGISFSSGLPSVDDYFIVETGEAALADAQAEVSSANDFSALEIETPYTYKDLWDNDEKCCKIQTIQHSDVMYIFNEGFPIKTLKRYSNMDWRLEDLEIKNGPFLSMNTEDTTIASDGTIGYTTLTASEDIFSATDVGRLIRLRGHDEAIEPWYAGDTVAKGEVRYSDNKYYEATSPGTTGSIKPVHSEGIRSDGAVRWKYLHDGYGIVRITAFSNPKKVTAQVISTLPEQVKKGTVYWEMGMLHAGAKHPKSGAFFRNRFAFLINTDEGPYVCLSESGDYNNFSDMEFGEATAETAITVPVLNTEFNEGQWIFAGEALFVGTGSGEFYIDAASSTSAMSSSNVKISQISHIGSKAVVPVAVGSHVFFADRYGLSLRDLIYNYYNDGYDQVDVSLSGKHLFVSRIVGLCYQEVPDKVLWCLMADGSVTAMTFSAEQEVAAFSRHDFSGSVESLAVIPNLDDCRDELWMEVRREIGSGLVRTVERLEQGMPQTFVQKIYATTDINERKRLESLYVQKMASYLDGAVLYERTLSDTETSISGLEHLEGKDVTIFADGAVIGTKMVINGKVDLDRRCSRVLAGLAVKSQYLMQNVYAGSESDAGIGQKQRINHVLLMLYLSGGGKVGEDENKLSAILYRPADGIVGTPEGLFTGNKEILFNGSTDAGAEAAALLIENDSPLPMNILAIVPYLDA